MGGGGFYDRVYDIVRRIPYGRVTSYGAIAAMAGHPRAAKAVGQAMRFAPEGLPCQRVVRGDGTCPPGLGFIPSQRELLELEGVCFTPDGRVDMKRYGWAEQLKIYNE